MKVVSWNINSVRLRLGLLKKLIEEEKPDVICLQETKVVNDLFPVNEIKSFGFDNIHFLGEKSYNGVAIISKFPLYDNEIFFFGGKEDSRCIKSVINGFNLYNIYIPAGGDIPDPDENDKFKHKLDYVQDLTNHFTNCKHEKTIILGDFNIAPLENDVWSHKQLTKVVSHTPIEIEHITKLQNSINFIDTHRNFVDNSEKLYSWWSYRNRNWEKSNRGRRLDHIWITPDISKCLDSSYIKKDCRNWDKPSDHVPIISVFK